MDLTCPKCHGTMRTYERNGVHVDQCSDCRGIFLDRGELDKLIDAENDWHGGQAAAPGAAEQPAHRSSSQQAASGAGLGAVVGEVLRQVQGSKHSSQHGSHHSSQHGSQHGSQHSGSYPRKKKESFLGDLFG